MIKLLSLFGGIGADKVALLRLMPKDKLKIIDYVDVLKYAVDAYNIFDEQKYVPQDIKDWNLDVDFLVHGSPCQDFSTVGKRRGGEIGSGTRSSLLWETIKIIKEKMVKLPQVVIWENVKGVLFKNNLPVFNSYLKELEKMGYKNKWKVLNGVDFGIPQRRERVFVISTLPAGKFKNFDFKNLEKFNTQPLSNYLEKNVDLSYFINQKSMVKAILRGKIKIIDNVAYTITTKQLRWNNAGVVKIPLTTFNQENYIFNIENSTLPTLTSQGANSRLKIAIPKFNDELPVFIIDKKPYHLRVITEKEAWRLMDFGDKYYNKIEHFPKTYKYMLAGNSIIVKILESIFKELINNNKEKKYA